MSEVKIIVAVRLKKLPPIAGFHRELNEADRLCESCVHTVSKDYWSHLVSDFRNFKELGGIAIPMHLNDVGGWDHIAFFNPAEIEAVFLKAV